MTNSLRSHSASTLVHHENSPFNTPAIPSRRTHSADLTHLSRHSPIMNELVQSKRITTLYTEACTKASPCFNYYLESDNLVKEFKESYPIYSQARILASYQEQYGRLRSLGFRIATIYNNMIEEGVIRQQYIPVELNAKHWEGTITLAKVSESQSMRNLLDQLKGMFYTAFHYAPYCDLSFKHMRADFNWQIWIVGFNKNYETERTHLDLLDNLKEISGNNREIFNFLNPGFIPL